MIIMRVAGTLGGDLERSRAICTPSVPRAKDGAACMSAMLGISGFRAQADVQEWSQTQSDECCALSRNGPNTRRPSTASARGRASGSRWPTTLQSSFPRCPAPSRGGRRARRWLRSGQRPSGAIKSSCSSRWRRWSWTIFHLAGSRTGSPQSRVWGASAADVSRHRRCGLPKIARMPTLASPNRVLHRGTPVKPSPGRAIAGWHAPRV